MHKTPPHPVNNNMKPQTTSSDTSTSSTGQASGYQQSSVGSSSGSEEFFVDIYPSLARFDGTLLTEVTDGNSELELDIMNTFFDSTEKELKKLLLGLENNDPTDSELYSHSIKGAAKYIGALKIAERAFLIETLSKMGNLIEARKQLPGLINEIKLTSQHINKAKTVIIPKPPLSRFNSSCIKDTQRRQPRSAKNKHPNFQTTTIIIIIRKNNIEKKKKKNKNKKKITTNVLV